MRSINACAFLAGASPVQAPGGAHASRSQLACSVAFDVHDPSRVAAIESNLQNWAGRIHIWKLCANMAARFEPNSLMEAAETQIMQLEYARSMREPPWDGKL